MSFEKLSKVKLTYNEEKILKFYLSSFYEYRAITTTRLVRELGYNNSSAWKYLNSLVRKGVFIEVVHGNPSTYEINDDFLLIYEERKRKEIVNY